MPTTTTTRHLLGLCTIVFLEFLAMGLPLPVLPMHVNGTLGFGSFIVGVTLGVQSVATLATRHLAGARSDDSGPKRAVSLGLFISALAAVAYALSTAVALPVASLAVLLVGRVLLGLGESLVITGALAWGFALAGRERAGIVMAWIGIAMYGALALGAPLGGMLDERLGFVAMSLAAMAAPLVALLAVPFLRRVEPVRGAKLPFLVVVSLIGRPGAGLALCAVGFGTISGFAALLFGERGWAYAPVALTSFGAAYVLARIFFGTFPDRFGGARVALVSAAVTAIGQLGLALASSATAAVVAAGITGFGFSLAFPAFGVEAMKRVPPQNRGAAVGAYTAFFDGAMGLGVPVLGLSVALASVQTPFIIGAVTATLSFIVALTLVSRDAR